MFSKWQPFKEYIHTILKQSKVKTLFSVLLTIFLGVTKGVSFIVLLPILQLAGVSESPDQNSKSFEIANEIWNMLGIPTSLYTSITIYLILVASNAAMGYLKTQLDTDITQGYVRSLRNELFSAVIRSEWGFMKNIKSTNVYNSLITEVNYIRYTSELVVNSLGTVVVLLFYIATSFYVSTAMTMIAILSFLPLFFLQRVFNKRVYKTGKEIYKRHESLFATVSEYISSFKLAKSYNLQNQYETNFQKITSQTFEDEYRFSRITSSTRIMYEVGSAVIICVVLVSAIQIIKIPVVDLLVMVYIASKLLPNISSLSRNLQYVLNTLPAFEEVSRLIREARENEEPVNVGLEPLKFPECSISFSRVWFSYDENTPIFRDFDCDIKVNKTTVIIGRSGEGKSTLMELFLGLLKPQRGSIKFDEANMNHYNLADWRSTTAYIPQECFLFHATIRENLLWAKQDATESELLTALQSAAGDFVLNLPHGLETIVGDQGIRLSGGERQRIALARALLRKPRILILDEATNALDTENEELIKYSLHQLKGKVTILIISHDQRMKDIADEVVFV